MNDREYFKEKRREAFGSADKKFADGWTEEKWIEVARHTDAATGTIVYHSYADYCDD